MNNLTRVDLPLKQPLLLQIYCVIPWQKEKNIEEWYSQEIYNTKNTHNTKKKKEKLIKIMRIIDPGLLI